MKKNAPLILGGLILFVILILIVFPDRLSHLNPYGTQGVKSWVENGKFIMTAPPFAPGPGSPLGTDDQGRDVLSLIIYGTRLTMLMSVLVVIGRYLVAIPLGLLAGSGSYVAKTILSQFSIIFSAIPALIFSIIILKMDFFLALDKTQSILAFVLVLTFVGWAKLATIVMERVQDLLSKPFIKAELAIGKGKLRIALENVLPHLVPELVVIFFMEISGALNMIMQLGVFGVFVGNLRYVASTEGGVITFLNISLEPEWSSMLATSRKYITSAPWMVLFPALVFFISILGFNLFGEGLRDILQKRDSRFNVYFRSLFTLHKSIIPFLKGLKTRGKVALVILGLVLLVGGIWINNPQANLPRFDYQSAGVDMPDFAKGVLIGTPEAAEAAEYISQSLKAVGFEPIEGKNLVRDYQTETIYREMTSSITCLDKAGQAKTLMPGMDYSIGSFGNLTLIGRVYDARQSDLFSVSMETLTDQFVLVDSSIYSSSAISNLTKKILVESKAKGVLIMLAPGQSLPESFGSEAYSGVKVWLTPASADLVTGKTFTLTLQCEKLGNKGKNIIGVLPGTDSKEGKEAIVIGIGYNYLPEDQEIGQQRIKFGLELAKKLSQENHNRKLILCFWDGTLSDTYHGVKAFAAN
ncbi:MAG TPA: ABC transporter permease subunit, partial [Desulfosporosinus sp.]|nr:ABC transporter permease subunit [Desulfosporosinus sp.]